MAPPSLLSASVPKAVGTSELPYGWEDIATKLGLVSSKDVSSFIFLPIFVDHWVNLRDCVPLAPGTAVDIIPANDKAAMVELSTTIYTAMDCMATSKYDRPTSADRARWNPIEHIECLVYQCARDLATSGRPFHSVFERSKLRNEAGRKDALFRIRGLAMLAFNLVVNYTLMPPSGAIRKIEMQWPAKDPSLSPIPEVRRKWQLEHMDLGELRKTVLDRQRKDGDEKQWLIDILMQESRDGGVKEEANDVAVKKGNGVRVGGVKRKKEEE